MTILPQDLAPNNADNGDPPQEEAKPPDNDEILRPGAAQCDNREELRRAQPQSDLRRSNQTRRMDPLITENYVLMNDIIFLFFFSIVLVGHPLLFVCLMQLNN